jgi:hypothetical protein
MIPADPPPWLFQSVPLWAFLLALLTSPAEWSRRVMRVIGRRFGGGDDGG